MDNNFHYNVVPQPGKTTVSTRIVLQDDFLQPELVAQVAAEAGVTPDVVIKVGTALFRAIILAGKIGRVARRIFGLITFTPSCGGSHADANFQPTAQTMNQSISGSLAPEGQALLDHGITFVRDGVLGEKLPEITRVYDATTRQLDRITAGGAFKLSGHDFGLEPDGTDLTLGVFVKPVAGGPDVRIAGYSEWLPKEIMGAWPAGLVGPQTLSVVAIYGTGAGATGRTFVYGTPLLP